MSEEDTYKRLRGLTYDEAFDIYKRITDFYRLDNTPLPWDIVRVEIDKELRPYGWTYDRMLETIITNHVLGKVITIL